MELWSPKSKSDTGGRFTISLPRSLVGRGEVDAVLTVDGKTANTVRIAIK